MQWDPTQSSLLLLLSHLPLQRDIAQLQQRLSNAPGLVNVEWSLAGVNI